MTRLSQRLDGLQCASCGQLFVAYQFHCPQCGGSEFRKRSFKGSGHVYSFTVIRVPPQQFVHEAPYTVAIVKLTEGPHLTARIDGVSDSQQLEIGTKVQFKAKEGSRYLFRLLTPRPNR